MAKRESAPAGPYVLTGLRWRRRTERGGWEQFTRGDTVDLSAEEAARLVGRPHSSFRTPPKGPSNNGDGDSDES